MHIIAGKAVCLKEAMSESFREYQRQVVKNAKALAEALMEKGFKIVSGGTDNHLMLVDLTNKGITGKDAQKMLDDVRITVNKNGIPFDTRSPAVASGIRIGTPAVTTRGMKEPEMREIATLLDMALGGNYEANKAEIIRRVDELTKRFPLYA